MRTDKKSREFNIIQTIVLVLYAKKQNKRRKYLIIAPLMPIFLLNEIDERMGHRKVF